jgi:hypothetical protein
MLLHALGFSRDLYAPQVGGMVIYRGSVLQQIGGPLLPAGVILVLGCKLQTRLSVTAKALLVEE